MEKPMGTADRFRSTAQRYAVTLEPTAVGRFWSRLLEVEFVDRAVALAAKLLVSVFPVLVVLVAISPDWARATILTTIEQRFGVDGGAREVLRDAFASPAETRQATGFIGVIITLAYATSFTTALQRTFLRAWRRPAGRGLKEKGRGAVWVGGVVALFATLGGVHALFRGPASSITTWAVATFLSVVMWWWTAWLMLRGEVRWRVLLPTGLLIGLGGWLYTLTASLWFPATVAKHYAQFGAFGLSLAFVTWFTGFAFIIIGAAVLGPALAEGEDRVARWLNPTGDYLSPGAAPPLPGPSRPMRLSDAFGRGAGGSGTAAESPPGTAE